MVLFLLVLGLDPLRRAHGMGMKTFKVFYQAIGHTVEAADANAAAAELGDFATAVYYSSN